MCFLILYTINQSHRHRHQNPYPVGGCRGTRYGCCPDNMTPKRDLYGSNCSSYLPPTRQNNTCPTSKQRGHCTQQSCDEVKFIQIIKDVQKVHHVAFHRHKRHKVNK